MRRISLNEILLKELFLKFNKDINKLLKYLAKFDLIYYKDSFTENFINLNYKTDKQKLIDLLCS